MSQRLLSDLLSLGRGQAKVMTDKEMMLLSADLADDPKFVVLKEDKIKDIRTHPERYISKELLTYVRLLEHELVLMNPLRTFTKPENHLERRYWHKVERFEEQLNLVHDILENLTEEQFFRMNIAKDGTTYHFDVDLPAGSEVLGALLEHLDQEIEYYMPVKDVPGIYRQEAIVKLRKKMARYTAMNRLKHPRP